MIRLIRSLDGRVNGVEIDGSFYGVGNPRWQDFFDWNAKQPVPLDLSDKPSDPVPVDVDMERVKEILAKKDADITNTEFKEVVLKFLRRRV